MPGIGIKSVLLVLLLLGSAPVAAQHVDQKAVAAQFLDRLDAGDYPAATRGFTADLTAAVSAESLQAVWESLPVQMGAALGRGEVNVLQRHALHLVLVPLRYGKGTIDAQIVVDAQGRIAGFHVQPRTPAERSVP